MAHVDHHGYLLTYPHNSDAVHDLLQQQLLHCTCMTGGNSAETWNAWQCQTDKTNTSLPGGMWPPGIAFRKAKAGPPAKLQNQTALLSLGGLEVKA